MAINREKGRYIVTKPTKYPRLKKSDMTAELIKRTGLDSKTVSLVLLKYHEIIRDTLRNSVEYSLPKIGVLTFAERAPAPAGVRWNGSEKRYMEMPARAGHLRVVFKCDNDFKKDILKNTLFGYEATPEEWNEWVMRYHPDDPRFAKWRLDKEESE